MSLAEGNSGGAAPRGLKTAARAIVVLAVLALIGVSIGGVLGAWIPSFVLFQPFAAQAGGAALVATILSLGLGMRRWTLAAAAILVWQGSQIVPFLWPAAQVPVEGPPLRVVSLNLWNQNAAPEETVGYLLQSGADVIGTVETTQEWRKRLTALEATYPYHVDCVFTVFRCGVALFSKLPITAFSAGPVEDGPPVIAWAQIDWEGKPLTVAELQVLNPMIGLRRGFQARQGDAMTRYFAALGGDAVLMGDFNSAPWSPIQRAFRAGTGFDNRGRLAFTWPSWGLPVIRLPIDQIFVRGALAVRGYRAGPPVGSDHLPVIAEIYRTSAP